jgi:UDP-N-acetylmuramoyl-L-alanyl-D-glutamate--2,6-diaminopimelate ligase
MVKLSDIAEQLRAEASGDGLSSEVRPADSAVTHDSRRAVPGGIFVAIKGAQSDGNRFVGQATQRGAIAVISEDARPSDFKGVWLRVADARAALAKAAALVHGHPSRRLKLVGLTGTNGKTTTAHLVESIFRAAGEKAAIMGTISYRIGDESFDAAYTTPEAPEIQSFLRRAVESGCRSAVMEVSSIALDLRRADELRFAAAAFSNLTQDHLDYHGTMEAYFAAKKRLFDGGIGERPAHAVINVDDAYGVKLAEVSGPNVLTYALEADADIKTGARELGFDGLHFTARTPLGEIEIHSPLVGRPHAYNVLCAVGVGLALGYSREAIERGVAACKGVPGRFEKASGDEDDITVIVDYAHTPDALENVLRTARHTAESEGSRVITVMGCGGDRDRTKRPLMGEAAARLSERVIATSDNPRTEDLEAILKDIEVGLRRAEGKYELIVDRREAISLAVLDAAPRDVVVIAGKGHETYQILPTGKIHFDDREVAREALARRKISNLRFEI